MAKSKEQIIFNVLNFPAKITLIYQLPDSAVVIPVYSLDSAYNKHIF